MRLLVLILILVCCGFTLPKPVPKVITPTTNTVSLAWNKSESDNGYSYVLYYGTNSSLSKSNYVGQTTNATLQLRSDYHWLIGAKSLDTNGIVSTDFSNIVAWPQTNAYYSNIVMTATNINGPWTNDVRFPVTLLTNPSQTFLRFKIVRVPY